YRYCVGAGKGNGGRIPGSRFQFGYQDKDQRMPELLRTARACKHRLLRQHDQRQIGKHTSCIGGVTWWRKAARWRLHYFRQDREDTQQARTRLASDTAERLRTKCRRRRILSRLLQTHGQKSLLCPVEATG